MDSSGAISLGDRIRSLGSIGARAAQAVTNVATVVANAIRIPRARSVIDYEDMSHMTEDMLRLLWSKLGNRYTVQDVYPTCKPVVSDSRDTYPKLKVNISSDEAARVGMRGYKIDNCQVAFHRVAAVIQYLDTNGFQATKSLLQGRDIKKMEASHLCHNSRCINPQHLLLEHRDVNKSRQGCVGTVICSGCEHSRLVCQHVPSCIKRLTI